MSNEIRERFEAYRDNDPYGRIKDTEKVACFVDFQAGHKSRDEEVRRLEAENGGLKEDNQYHFDFNSKFVQILYREKDELMYERNDLKAENKKLRGLLKNLYVNRSKVDRVDRLLNNSELKQTLKDGE